MEYRSLDVTVIAAEGLKDVNMFSKMDVYVMVTILGYPKNNKRTHIDKNAGTSPRWNHRFKFTVDEPSLHNPSLSILFQLRCHRSFGWDKDIGEVTVLVEELFSDAGASESAERVADYQVKTASGKARGTLKISYKFGEKLSQQQPTEAMKKNGTHHDDHQPVTAANFAAVSPPMAMAYPPTPHPGMGTPVYQQAPMGMGFGPYGYGGYPAPGPHGYPQAGPGYGYGYGYAAAPAPPAPGYGYGPGPMQHMHHQPKKNKGKGKMGMGLGLGAGAAGLGLGLGAGLLGGMMVEEAVSDVGEMAAYADGYGDAMENVTGGFGF